MLLSYAKIKPGSVDQLDLCNRQNPMKTGQQRVFCQAHRFSRRYKKKCPRSSFPNREIRSQLALISFLQVGISHTAAVAATAADKIKASHVMFRVNSRIEWEREMIYSDVGGSEKKFQSSETRCRLCVPVIKHERGEIHIPI